jgi:hypothetical protein
MDSVSTICKATSQRGNALVLLILLKTWGGDEAPDHYELAELAHISPRQAERDLLKLVADGDVERLSPEHNGGRGHKTRWQMKAIISNDTPSETPSDVSESDKTPTDVTDFQGKETAPQVTGIMETTTDVTGLSDVIHDKSDVVPVTNPVTSVGTPVAPSKAKELLSTETEANASGAESAGYSTHQFVGLLLKFRREDLGVKKLPVEQGEAAAAKWMHSQGWPLADVQACYTALKAQHWRGLDVTLIEVKKQYPAWKKGDLNGGERTQQQQRNGKPSRSEVTRNRDYSVFDRDGGADAGADTRPLPRVAGVATPTRR